MSLFRPILFDHTILPPFGLFDPVSQGSGPVHDDEPSDSSGTAALRRNHPAHDAHLSILNNLWPSSKHHAGSSTAGGGFLSNYLAPKIDLHEEGDKYKLSAELAGVPKDNIKLNVDERSRRLTISGEVRSEYDSSKTVSADAKKDASNANDAVAANTHSRPLISERVYGSFTRSIILPETVDLANLKASFKDGVLGVTIPKKTAEVAKNRSVTISDGDDE